MIRFIASAVAVLASTAWVPSAEAAEKLACETQASAWDSRSFNCPVKATGAAQRLRFVAHFSGGHDDTIASITTTTLNGAPLTCEAGSKTRLMGEDGDVILDCRISVKENAATLMVLGVALAWSHAEYQSVELVSD